MADETVPSSLERDAQLFERVTEALRAGPGTAAWEEAIGEIGVSGGDVSAEMEALAKVRRRLASGRGWREVSAGEGFTAKVWAGLEEPVAQKGGATVTRIVVGLALALLVGIGVAAAVLLYRDRGSANASGGLDLPVASERPREGAKEAGAKTGFGSPRLAWDFGMPWPGGTSVAGTLALDSSAEGLRVKPGVVGGSGNGWQGAAAFSSVGWPAEADVLVELTLDVPQMMSPGVVTQLFVTTSETLDPIRGTSQGEWVCQVDEEGVKVVSGGGGGSDLVKVSGPVEPGTLVLRATMKGKRVQLDGGPGVQWEGEHGLAEDQPRFVGVRLLAKGKVPEGGVPTVKLVRVLNVK